MIKATVTKYQTTLPLWMANNFTTMYKKITIIFSLLLITLMGFAQELPPKSTTLVTDYTNTLSAGDKQALESKLVAYDDTSTTQIAVVIIKSVGSYDIAEYGQKLGRAWGIGQKGKNNGLLVLVALNDHRVTIQTGYGAEGALPDVRANEIIDNDIVPRFKQNDYYGGLNAGTDDIMKYMRGEYKATNPPHHNRTRNEDNGGGGYGILIFIVIIILVIIFRGRGGGGHIIGGRGGASPFWWFLGGALLGRGSGGWGGFSNGGGGFGGGDSGGGGFGGFGGGDFGGGGASGSW
jgi:uncharacterized protein